MQVIYKDRLLSHSACVHVSGVSNSSSGEYLPYLWHYCYVVFFQVPSLVHTMADQWTPPEVVQCLFSATAGPASAAWIRFPTIVPINQAELFHLTRWSWTLIPDCSLLLFYHLERRFAIAWGLSKEVFLYKGSSRFTGKIIIRILWLQEKQGSTSWVHRYLV